MTRLERLEQEIAELSPAELHDLRAWFAAFDAGQWDRQFERDAESGALDGWRSRRLPIIGPDEPAPCEAFRQSGLLGLLRPPPRPPPAPRRREFCGPEDQSAPPLAASETHRQFLVCSRRAWPPARSRVNRTCRSRRRCTDRRLATRALAREQDGDLIWFWIGTHSEYDRALGRQ